MLAFGFPTQDPVEVDCLKSCLPVAQPLVCLSLVYCGMIGSYAIRHIGQDAKMRILGWEEARKILSPVDVSLAAALDRLYEAATTDQRSKLTVALASYSYGADVVLWGVPKSELGGDMADEFILPTHLPLGIILKNGLEVLEAFVSRIEKHKNLETRLFPQALLGPGRLIGVFEILDWKLTGKIIDNVDWNITAGSRTIYVTERHDKDSVLKVVQKQFGHHPPTVDSLFEWLSSIPTFSDIISDWRTEVMYFSKSWFNDQYNLGIGPTPNDPHSGLYHCLLERAWPSLSRLKPNSALLYDVLREADGERNPHRVEAAYQLLDHWAAIRSASRPCFSPAREDGELGPFGKIIENFLQPILGCSSVLRPAYLSNGQKFGFLKLRHIAPGFFSNQLETNLRSVVTLIADATNSAINMANVTAQRALGWPYIVNDLTFRVPATRNRGVVYLRFDTSNNSSSTNKAIYREIQIEGDNFFSGYNSEAAPPERCEFFYGSLKVSL